jgi:hypothetical protein
MLNRDQQQLLGSLGAGMAADALLDGLRERGTLEGGRSADQAGCWINYNRKAVWLEDHSEFSAALRAAGDDSATDATQAWRRIRPKIVLKVTWAQAAAYGATLPHELRTELRTLRRTERDENRTWWEFSNERGGWPWRHRFATDEEHKTAETEWDAAYSKHLTALREVWDRQKVAIARALPLTVDDEPVDLLELLDQQPAAPAAPAGSASIQAGALRAAATAPAPTAVPDEGLFTLPSTAPGVGR